MTYFDKNALKLSHEYIKSRLCPSDTAVDATAGKGRDTLLLSSLCSHVFAFDIQKEALSQTESLLNENGRTNVTLIHDSHHNMKKYVSSASCVVFNFGFLPGGDHKIYSSPETSIPAISAALDILTENGFVSICSYYGGDTGFEEVNAILKFLKTLDSKKYTVMLHSFYNRPNCPPIFIVIEKN